MEDLQIAESTEQHAVTQAAKAVAEPDPALRPARLALYLGIALIVIGGIVLYRGYDGAAHNPLVQAQMPFLISGGIFGLALMMLGGISLGVYVILRVQADLRSELNEVRVSVDQLADVTAKRALSGSNGASANGFVMVTRGSSTYHKPDCSLVQRSGSANPVAKADAAQRGLTACRICRP
ncbi:MAG: hypothetical protein ABR552_03450 [Actinomycetota bacterium]